MALRDEILSRPDCADALAARGIPFAFTSGGGDIIPAEHAHRRLVAKPFRISDIEAVLDEFSAGN